VAHWKAAGTGNYPTFVKASFQSSRLQILLSCDAPGDDMEALSQIDSAIVEK